MLGHSVYRLFQRVWDNVFAIVLYKKCYMRHESIRLRFRDVDRTTDSYQARIIPVLIKMYVISLYGVT